MKTFFTEVLYRPLFNALVFLYNTVAFRDLGLAIILLTLLIRFVLYPLFYKSFKNQLVMQRLQPHIKKIQETHKDDKHQQAAKLMELYKEHKFNPFSGIFLLILQLPVLIALYRVFLNDFTATASLKSLYSFIAPVSPIQASFFGLIDLTKPSMIVLVLAVVAQYFQAKAALPKQSASTPATAMGKQMLFIGPLITFFILLMLPAAIGFYWVVSSLFSIFQQFIVTRSLDLKPHGNLSRAGQEIR